MKVYVLTEGEYSDYHIEAVKLDKEEADRLALVHPDWEIEEFDTDDVRIPERTRYTVWVNENGLFDIQEGEYYGIKAPVGTVVFRARRFLDEHEWTAVIVDAKDACHAIKIASDLIAKARYAKEIDEVEEE